METQVESMNNMQVNTDSVAILTKQVLKSEVEILKSKPATIKNLSVINALQDRIKELEQGNV